MEYNTEYRDAARFPAWYCLAVFSAVCIASISSSAAAQDAEYNRRAPEKWALFVASISLILSFLSIVAYVTMRGVYMGQLPEAAMAILCLALWGLGVPVIMHPSRSLAVTNITVINANLYFFTWASFTACIYLVGNIAQDYLGIASVASLAKSPRWFGLTASSLVVMGSSVRIFKRVGCNSVENVDLSGSKFCIRTRFAMSVGIIGFFAALSMTTLLQIGLLEPLLEAIVAAVLLVIWCFGVGYITFGESPGSQIGNLYFSTWISFLLIVFLFANASKDVFGVGTTPQQQQQEDEARQQDLELEEQQHQQQRYDGENYTVAATSSPTGNGGTGGQTFTITSEDDM